MMVLSYIVMGGIFLLYKKIVKLLAGYGCGFLFIVWVPIHLPNNLSTIIVELVLSPVQFIAATFAFLIGFVIHAELIRDGTQKLIYCLQNKKTVINIELLILLIVFVTFYILSKISLWPTVVFFCFSFLYGMISIDFKQDAKRMNS